MMVADHVFLKFDGGHAQRKIPSSSELRVRDLLVEELLFEGYDFRFRKNHAAGHPALDLEVLMASYSGMRDDYFAAEGRGTGPEGGERKRYALSRSLPARYFRRS